MHFWAYHAVNIILQWLSPSSFLKIYLSAFHVNYFHTLSPFPVVPAKEQYVYIIHTQDNKLLTLVLPLCLKRSRIGLTSNIHGTHNKPSNSKNVCSPCC